MQNDNQFSLHVGVSKEPKKEKKILYDVIIDRKSKYTIVIGSIKRKGDIKPFISELLTDSYFRKATHNSYAYRIKEENGLILEGKNDDGEQGAGMCILRELKREEFINGIIIVTRYFGGVQLHADRFKNVIEATKKALGDLGS